MANTILDPTAVHPPRNVDWHRAPARLWRYCGASRAYVIGLAAASAGCSSLTIIRAVGVLTAEVASKYNRGSSLCLDGCGGCSAGPGPSGLLTSTGAILLVAR